MFYTFDLCGYDSRGDVHSLVAVSILTSAPSGVSG